jgi:hypothetical protein
VYDPENSIPLDDKKTLPGYVTLLRLLVSPDPQVAGVGATPDVLFGPEFIPKFTRDLKRSKWLDDRTLNLAFPPASSGKRTLGTSKVS